MKRRRWQHVLPLLLPLASILLIAQTRPAPGPAASPSAPSVVLDGRELAVRVTITPSGPLFALAPIAQGLGGELKPGETGESFTLRIGDKDVVLAVGSAVVTVGDSIVSLSQPPTRAEGGVQVPLDFLAKTYGDVLGYSFDWRPETQRLTITRRSAREIPVSFDVVHLQGMTTVVLQFPEVPRYHLVQQAGAVEVQMLSDRLAAAAPARKVEDPLVKTVDVAPEKVHVELAPGAEVESYVLQNPFRLVFDVHAASAATAPIAPAFAPPAQAAGIHTIVVDPGHGGPETGAIGPGGVQEKELTLLLAQQLASRLQQRLPVRAVLTRSEDTQLGLDARPAIANQNKADLFISIHLNSSLGAGAHGAETYFLAERASDLRAASSAQQENAALAGVAPATPGAGPGAEPGEGELQLMLWDLAQSRHLTESQRLANLVQGELNETLQLKDRGVKQAPFRVLVGATMPAILVELGFLSNPDEEKKLQDPEYRAQLVEALVKAIARYKDAVEGHDLGARPADATPAAPGTKPSSSPAPPAPAQGTAPPRPAGAGAGARRP
ncbi:MAG TPA: N-acetylmuramoyl-L-alanine amidase [Thermoanaerobaculia bacterium]